MKLGPGKTGVVRARWHPERERSPPFQDFDGIFDARIREADEFFAALQPGLGTDARAVHRQAIAGLLWSKQFYYYDVPKWLAGDPGQPEPPVSRPAVTPSGST
ncbi:hypothetical protein [Rhizobium indicum]|uniref:Uncharacterized protein n=1 Tax=Rhizobium indicum TaxID=2583231 RepID=A0ABX6PP96_9HYPH|nr:hypothetical protein [Rhizobium indicum]QKK20456.1 hypothetical protein FFM53_029140 [Rhizobium indicum]